MGIDLEQAALGLGALVLGFAGLAWLAARRPQPPRTTATGTLGIWEQVEGARHAQGSAVRREPPPRLYALLLGLVFLALGVAAPRRAPGRGRSEWVVVLDRSASMGLPDSEGTGRTREALAVERGAAWLDELGVAQGARTWIDGAGREVRGAVPPEAWLEEPFGEAPSWARYDAPGHLWLSDVAPDPVPDAASWLALGAEATPGRVSESLRWNGEQLVEEASSDAGSIHAEGLPPLLDELVELWREERGLARGPEARGARLVLEVAEESPLSSASPPGLLESTPGRLRVARGADLSAGDPARIAAAWAQALDAALLPAPGAAPLAERRASGPSGRHLGEPPRPERVAGGASPLSSWLYSAAALLVGLWVLGLRTAPGQAPDSTGSASV